MDRIYASEGLVRVNDNAHVSGILGPLRLVKKEHCHLVHSALPAPYENSLKWKPHLLISPLSKVVTQTNKAEHLTASG